jgi:serine/threonine protein kinase
MTAKRDVASVEGLCEQLARSRLLAAEEARSLGPRWRREARGPADLVSFTRWLVANQYATEFQVAMLLQGHGAQLRLGPYKLLERIGRGQLALVYKAVHRLGRVVALKVLSPSRARDPQVLARFQHEARRSQALDHPNVVRAFDAGEEQGLHYLVLEYLEGETLQQALDRRGRLGVDEAVEIVCQALDGLQHLHEQGMVHRNLEPANLMLVRSPPEARPPEGPQTVVKILDISLSRSALEEGLPAGEGAGRLTHEGLLLGSPAYLAPEQAQDAHAADIRADIYSLGCVLYHALAGQPPYQDPNPVQQIIRHATEKPRPLRELNPEVPEALELIVNWMTAKNPSRRYQTPERAAGALRIFLAGERASLPLPGPDPEPEDVEPPAPEVVPFGEGPTVSGDDPAPGLEDLAFAAPPPDSGPPLIVEPAPARKKHGGPRRHRRLTRRDWLLLAGGAAGLLAAQGAGWLLGRLARVRDAGPADRKK